MSAAKTFVAVLTALAALLRPAFADTLYLKVEDIKGDVPDLDHKDWSFASGFSYGVSRSISVREGGSPQFSNLTVTKSLDASSPFLFKEATVGKPKDVEIELVRTSDIRERYYRIKLYDALISGYSTSSGGERPLESISFDYTRIDVTYTDYMKEGHPSTTAWYDLKTQVGGIQNSNPPNTAPTITAIPNTTTDEDTPVSVSFVIGDAETAAGSLALSAEVSTPGLASVTFSGSGSNRSTQIQPMPNQNGSTVVTIRVSDGSLSASSSFSLTVNPQNDPPTISGIASQTTAQNTPVTVAVVIGDVDTAPANLVLTGGSDNASLVPSANITFGGTGTNRTVTIQPVAGAHGQANITLTVTDGSLSASLTFLLVVNQTGTLDIFLSNNHVPESSPGGTVVGTLSATVAGATFTLADSAEARFRIQGNQLQVNSPLDYEASSAHSVLVSALAPGAGEFTKAFTVFIDDVNEAPLLVVLNTSTLEAVAGRDTPILRLQLSDPETNGVALSLQAGSGIIRVTPSLGVSITDNNTSQVLISGTPAALSSLLSSSNIAYRANTGISGTDLLTATAIDGPYAIGATLPIRIYRRQYDQWLHTQFPEEYLNDPAMEAFVWGYHVDLDGDRLETLAEYALGTDIFTPDPISPSVAGALSVAIKKRQDPDLRLDVEVASELEPNSWSSDPSVLEAFAPVDLGNGFDQLHFADRLAVTAETKRFIRLRWTLSP